MTCTDTPEEMAKSSHAWARTSQQLQRRIDEQLEAVGRGELRECDVQVYFSSTWIRLEKAKLVVEELKKLEA